MLSFYIEHPLAEKLGWEVVLCGETVHVYGVNMVLRDRGKVAPVRSQLAPAEGVWDFAKMTVAFTMEGFPEDLLPEINGRLREMLEPLDPARQQGLLPDACSVCGTSEVTFPNVAVRDQYDGAVLCGAPEKVTWKCIVCERLVCRNCVLTVDDQGQEIWHNTYCSHACRAAAPVELLEEDVDHRL